jgi:hypothetical protein
MRIPRLVSVLAGGLPCLLAAAVLPAQVVVVDEGIFTISIAGERVGREDFSIRRNVADGGYIAQGNVLRTEGRSSVVLSTDSAGSPFRFQIERFVAGRRVESTSGEYRRGLWSGRTVGPTGESGREFRLPDVVLAADDGVIHHAWFLLRFLRGGPQLVLRPRGLVVRPMVVESQGPDSVLFGLDVYDAERWLVRDGIGGPVLREVWVDAQGRLLRVRIPAADLEATRDEAPPEAPRETSPPAGAYEGPEPLLTGFGLDACAVAGDPASRGGDAGGGPGGPADVDADRGAGDRQEEQPDLPAVDHGAHAGGRLAPVGVRAAAP